MILDAQATLSDKQSLIMAAGTALSSRSYDLGASATDNLGNTIPSDVGAAKHPEFVVQMTTALDSAGGAATVKVEVVMADDEALTSNLTVLCSSEAIPEATALAGYQFRFGAKLPIGVSKRFIGFRYTIAGEDATAGAVLAAILFDKQTAGKN